MPQSSGRSPLVRGGRFALGIFVRGAVHLHFTDEHAVTEALRGCGFEQATVLPADAIVRAPGPAASLGLARIADACTARR
jgi:hypothetical protein